MKKISVLLFLSIATMFVLSCKTSEMDTKNNTTKAEFSEARKMEPNVIGSKVVSPKVFVYKTRKDYSDNVPVIMDDTKTKIISYPAPGDLKKGKGFATPTKLNDNLLLDNRGIGPNVAFLSYTYSEYSSLKSAPSMETLLNSIIDKDPLTFYVYCGRRSDYNDIVKELNALIENKQIYSMGRTTCPEQYEEAK